MNRNPKASSPKVLAATLQWNHGELTKECVESLLKLDYPVSEVLVADNASTDGSYEKIRGLFPQVRVARVRQNENLGYGEGVNEQIRLAFESGADYLFSVENDGRVEPSALSHLVRAMEEDPRVGITFPEVEGAPGGFFLVRMEAVKKAGYLDPDYFIYYDLEEWVERIRQSGYTERTVPEAKIFHRSHGTIGAGSAAFYYYQTRNRLYFLKRNNLPVFARRPPLFQWDGLERFRGSLWGVIDFVRGKRRNRDFGKGKTKSPKFWGLSLPRGQAGPKGTVPDRARNPARIRVRIDWNIGDEVIATPVYEALKQKYPGALIDAEVRYPELILANPFVDSVNLYRRGESEPDLVIDLHQEFRDRPRMEYLSEIAGVEHWGVPKVYLTEEEIREVRKKWLGDQKLLRIALNTEAGWFTKRWPFENWIALAEYFARVHGAEILVLGKEGRPLPLGLNLIGETTLRETAVLMSQCRLYFGSDSGPLYLALAVGTPSVGLYGPLDPSLLSPKQAHFIPVYSEVECRGCWPDYRMKHPDHCPKVVPDCLNTIKLERVIEAGEKLLKVGSYA